MNPFPRVEKHLLDPARVRRIREGFSWIDRRFVREGFVDALSGEETLLYLFLVCVADKSGLSYYGDRRVAATLKISEREVARVRERLVERGLLAYERPLYQVLELPAAAPPPRREARRFAEILHEVTRRAPPAESR